MLIYGGFQKCGTPKWMVYNGKSHWSGWFGGTPISENPHIIYIDLTYVLYIELYKNKASINALLVQIDRNQKLMNVDIFVSMFIYKCVKYMSWWFESTGSTMFLLWEDFDGGLATEPWGEDLLEREEWANTDMLVHTEKYTLSTFYTHHLLNLL